MSDIGIKLHEEIYRNIRYTDEISFKLIRLVPIFSGSGIAILKILEKQELLGNVGVLAISLIAAALTFGLYRWELRNIQVCSWLYRKALALEETEFDVAAAKQLFDSRWKEKRGQAFTDRGKGPSFFPPIKLWRRDSNKQFRIGKTESETLIYFVSMVAWAIPIFF